MKTNIKIFIAVAILTVIVSGSLWFILKAIFESPVKTVKQKKKKDKPYKADIPEEIDEAEIVELEKVS